MTGDGLCWLQSELVSANWEPEFRTHNIIMGALTEQIKPSFLILQDRYNGSLYYDYQDYHIFPPSGNLYKVNLSIKVKYSNFKVELITRESMNYSRYNSDNINADDYQNSSIRINLTNEFNEYTKSQLIERFNYDYFNTNELNHYNTTT